MNKTHWNLTGSQISMSSTKFVFSGRSENKDDRPVFWLADTFLTSTLNQLNGVQWNLTGNKISTSSTKFVFFGPIRKTRWPPWPLIGWDIFDFSSETAERNSMKLDRKQDLNVLYRVCVFRADRKNKMAVLASDWLRHFRLLLWNRWTEFNETWQEARSQRPLPSLCFPADRKNKMAVLASDWLRHFQLLLWNCWTELNKTWQEVRSQRPLPSLFFGPIGKTRWPPWPLIGWDIFDFFSETAERNSTSLLTDQPKNTIMLGSFWAAKLRDFHILFKKISSNVTLWDLYAPMGHIVLALSVLLSFCLIVYSFRSIPLSYMYIFKWNLVYRCVMRVRIWFRLNNSKQSYAPWTWKKKIKFPLIISITTETNWYFGLKFDVWMWNETRRTGSNFVTVE